MTLLRVRLFARRLTASEWLVVGGLTLMATLTVQELLRAQGFTVLSQDGINATLATRVDNITTRLDKLESMETGVIVGVFTNLVALFLALIKGQIGSRGNQQQGGRGR